MKSKNWILQLAAGISFLLAGLISLADVGCFSSILYFILGIVLTIIGIRNYKSNKKS